MKALITGISGFAGSYLTEFLIEKGYEVFGIFLTKVHFPNKVTLFKENNFLPK
jgi:GDP-D-mannose dehydratase